MKGVSEFYIMEGICELHFYANPLPNNKRTVRPLEEVVMTLWNELAALAVKLVVAIIGVIFSAIVLPWVKSTVIPWLTEKHLYGVIEKFVRAAEKEFCNVEGAGADKKAYVISHLEKAGIRVNETVKALIEAAVEELELLKDSFTGLEIKPVEEEPASDSEYEEFDDDEDEEEGA